MALILVLMLSIVVASSCRAEDFGGYLLIRTDQQLTAETVVQQSMTGPNGFSVAQSGQNNMVVLSQLGSANLAVVNQSGAGHLAIISQR
ncbi:curlin repeat-containing protein [Rhodopseudomonas pseudopalustris]|uniref:Curlin associated repeat-containing protein n=1 Tax=Rhodopseudomonas pseudopalustris TaxID=1513892 RepID=A0A1H8T2B4_9BRAD|nr:curlin repeat-containing protein [Rhodopseudomonas pseudopalustris]SEO85067.1 Curlin associated repeat-containing protein [Rhodopseudomonas pseudopalustris]